MEARVKRKKMARTIPKILLGFEPDKKNLLPALKEIGAEFGHVGEKEAEKVAEYFQLPLSQIFEAVSFYDLIATEKKPRNFVEVCFGPTCTLSQKQELIREIENYFKIKLGDENNPEIRLGRMSCAGMCAQGPVIRINGKFYTQVDKAKLHRIIEELGL